jgi:hypothetical protein
MSARTLSPGCLGTACLLVKNDQTERKLTNPAKKRLNKELWMMNVRTLNLCSVAAACILLSLSPVASAFDAKKEEKKHSPFAGSYTGTFTFMSQQGEQEGELTITIDDGGNVTGEAKNTTSNVSQTIKGTLLKDSKAAIVLESPQQKTSAFGTISKTAAGGITGTMTQRLGTTAVGSFEFEIKPKPKKD